MIHIQEALSLIFGFMKDVVNTLSTVSVRIGNNSINLLFFIFGGILISAVVSFVSTIIAKG